MADEIIKELWAIKDRSAKNVDYDVRALCKRLRRLDKQTTARVIDLSKQCVNKADSQ